MSDESKLKRSTRLMLLGGCMMGLGLIFFGIGQLIINQAVRSVISGYGILHAIVGFLILISYEGLGYFCREELSSKATRPMPYHFQRPTSLPDVPSPPPPSYHCKDTGNLRSSLPLVPKYLQNKKPEMVIKGADLGIESQTVKFQARLVNGEVVIEKIELV